MVQFLSILLSKEGYDVHVARSGKDALEKADEENFDVVVTDIKMPGEIDGLGVLSGVKKIDPSVPVVIRTAFASQKSAIEALNRGAFQYIEKSAKNDEIRLAIKNALAMRRVQSENLHLKRQLKRTDDAKEIIGHSEPIQRVLKLVEKVADSDRKSTRLNSSHSQISYAVFCLKKKKKKPSTTTGILIGLALSHVCEFSIFLATLAPTYCLLSCNENKLTFRAACVTMLAAPFLV